MEDQNKKEKPDFSHVDPKFLEAAAKLDMTGDQTERLTSREKIEVARRLQAQQAAEDKLRR